MFKLLNWFPFFGQFLEGFNFGDDDGDDVQVYTPPSYRGPRPFEAADVGYTPQALKGLAEAFLPELMRRARGEGLVGFEPGYRSTLRSEFLKDFGDYERDVLERASAQASGQGLRGGIPASIRSENIRNLARAREAGLADIDIRDLEARREDINRAFYQQPEEIQRGAGIQENAARLGLAEYELTKPIPYIIQDEPSQIGPELLQSATQLGTAYLARSNPYAALALALANQMKNQGRSQDTFGNKSLNPYEQLPRGFSPIY